MFDPFSYASVFSYGEEEGKNESIITSVGVSGYQKIKYQKTRIELGIFT